MRRWSRSLLILDPEDEEEETLWDVIDDVLEDQ